MIEFAGSVVAKLIAGFARAVTGVRARWLGCAPEPKQRIYFANHASHGDFVLIWTALPPPLRAMTRPIAGKDYWDADEMRRFIGRHVFNSVLINRNVTSRRENPLGPIEQALSQGYSLILFPEGTRNTGSEPLLPFKPGLFHLARSFPNVELVPVWIDNIGRVLPKGEVIPVPLLCSVTFGHPIRYEAGEAKPAFLLRAQSALLNTSPDKERRHAA
ncbi:MAG: 1-acyl-sn-glycerol-3-phosphate acyltransferase [Hyphomicrobium sp.]|nr:1-acyl-sn-glycerol-3-phosphate acyltransferase [Hyphomicrobium sp.]